MTQKRILIILRQQENRINEYKTVKHKFDIACENLNKPQVKTTNYNRFGNRVQGGTYKFIDYVEQHETLYIKLCSLRNRTKEFEKYISPHSDYYKYQYDWISQEVKLKGFSRTQARESNELANITEILKDVEYIPINEPSATQRAIETIQSYVSREFIQHLKANKVRFLKHYLDSAAITTKEYEQLLSEHLQSIDDQVKENKRILHMLNQ